jgi:hypothetical protein
MSLINDALKKAARQRAQEQEGDLASLIPGGGGRARERTPARAQSMVLIGGAAVALVVVSAVVTGIFLSGKSGPKAPAALSQPSAQKEQAAEQPPPVAVRVPQISVPTALAARAPAEAPAAQTQPRSTAAAISPPAPSPSPAVVVRVPESAPSATASAAAHDVQTQAKATPAPAAPAPAAPPPAAAAATPLPVAAAPAPAPTAVQSLAERVQAVIDRIQISGVRYAGSDSKAIIDGHIYRINDVLDKALGIRLSKFDQDHLTFVDPTGATYAKSF